MVCLSDQPDLEEIVDVIDSTQEGRSPGKFGILAEIWKHGGTEIVSELHRFILKIWSDELTPKDWRNASVILIFKTGSRRECGN